MKHDGFGCTCSAIIHIEVVGGQAPGGRRNLEREVLVHLGLGQVERARGLPGLRAAQLQPQLETLHVLHVPSLHLDVLRPGQHALLHLITFDKF